MLVYCNGLSLSFWLTSLYNVISFQLIKINEKKRKKSNCKTKIKSVSQQKPTVKLNLIISLTLILTIKLKLTPIWSKINCIVVIVVHLQVVSDCLWPSGLQLARLLCPWNFHARILEWVAISYSRGSSPPRDWTHITCICCIGGQNLYHWATCEAQNILDLTIILILSPVISLTTTLTQQILTLQNPKILTITLILFLSITPSYEVHGVAKSRTRQSNWTELNWSITLNTKTNPKPYLYP